MASGFTSITLSVASRAEVEEQLGFALDSEQAVANPDATFEVLHRYAINLSTENSTSKAKLIELLDKEAREGGAVVVCFEPRDFINALRFFMFMEQRAVPLATLNLTPGASRLV